MSTAGTREEARLTLQDELDAGKSALERNIMGQFATPTKLALHILEYGCGQLASGQPIRFLDPAIGTGSFYSALTETVPPHQISRADGYEIDPHYGLPMQALWRESPLNVHLADFTTAIPPPREERANLLICNPPYVRHHHLSRSDKARLLVRTREASGVRLSGLAGLYCHFLLIAHEWMVPGAVAAWLIPSEFMDVNYGLAIKQYLMERVTLTHIHRFDPTEIQFDDALVSSAVVWIRNHPPTSDHQVQFSYGGSLQEPREQTTVPVASLSPAEKWSGLASGRSAKSSTSLRLGDLFRISRGLVTGANDFFVISGDQAMALDIPKEMLRPILPSPGHLTGDRIAADEQGEPMIDRRQYLIDCSLPLKQVRDQYPSLATYFDTEKAHQVQEGYLISRRSPWYVQEKRPPAPIICNYMGRTSNKHSRPFRFYRNDSQATAANVYLMLYPNVAMSEGLLDDVWGWLNTLDSAELVAEGRVYGGGLHKLEPKELANLPVPQEICDQVSVSRKWQQPQLM